MKTLTKIEKDLLDRILQYAVNSDDFESWTPVIKNIYYKLNLE